MFLNISKTLKIQVEEVFLSFKDFLKPQGIQRKEENNYAWERPWNIFFPFLFFQSYQEERISKGEEMPYIKGRSLKTQKPEKIKNRRREIQKNQMKESKESPLINHR